MNMPISEVFLIILLLGEPNNQSFPLPPFMANQFPKYVILLFSVCLWVQTCHSSTEMYTMPRDSLKPGDILNHTTQLCSARKIFCMSFSTFDYDPYFTYLRISYDTQTAGTIWIGNRNKPVVNNSGVLTLDHYGTLKIIPKGEEGKPIEVLYSPTQPMNNSEATLLDTGNLMLQELHPNGSAKSVLWQSFDYPTDKLLPGMKLGVDHKTRHNWSLVSKITTSNPASGEYTLEWESKNAELIIRTRGLIYWKSGSYRSNKPFENIPEEFRSLYHFTVVSNEEEDYFTFTTQNKSDDKISYWTLTYDGKVSEGKSSSDKYIARADQCYGFNEGGGCQKLKNMSTCWSPVGKYVENLYGYINFTDKRNLEYVQNDTNSRLTRVDCGQKCWSICDCVGFFTIYGNDTGCTFLRRDALHVITYIIHPGDPKEAPVIYALRGPSHREGKKMWIWRSAVIATSLLIIYLFILSLGLRKRKIILQERKQESTPAMILELKASNESSSANDLQEEISKGHDLTMFSYESIMEATNRFSIENKLGEGGFGLVYKGILPTGKEVAIKRLSKTSGQGVSEFKNELTLICELQHMNLVQLLGCCIHKEERMLIYEYMPNKSLDFFLFDSTRSQLLDWQKRFNIIEGIAQGLLYLHKYSRLKVIHRDLKASNILLDENMNPKISDFGMARMFKQHESEANTIRIVGTYGYMSPEYAMDGVFSTKSDVFSFGVLLLEIVSGKRNNSFYSDDGPFNLVEHAWKLWKEGASLQLMDPTLFNSYVHTEVLRCIHIGILCVEEDANDRPHMSNIISMLTNQSAVFSSPKRPAFNTRRTMIEAESSSKESDINSINKFTLSILDVR